MSIIFRSSNIAQLLSFPAKSRMEQFGSPRHGREVQSLSEAGSARIESLNFLLNNGDSVQLEMTPLDKL